MTMFKCKMCGGELELQPNVSIAECLYCGTKQTVPQIDDDKKARLYNRANQYRLNNEFDKAYSAYETIIAEKEDEAEAYWGLVLSEYGVEYVEDPGTKKRIPTCHRTLLKSVTSNANFKSACKYADSECRMMYEDEAEEIDSLQKKIINASAKEEPYDVFICYKETDENGERTKDSVLAQTIYQELNRAGLRVFFARISLEDKLGKDYEPCIYAALTSSKVMLMVTTDSEHCNSVWVKNEWKRYIDFMKNDESKVLIPVYQDISPYTLPDEFSKLQAQDMSKIGAIQDLVRGVEKIVGKNTKENTGLGEHEKELLNQLEKSQRRTKVVLKIAVIITLTIVAGIGLFTLPFMSSLFDFTLFYTHVGNVTTTNLLSLNQYSLVVLPCLMLFAGIFDVALIFQWSEGLRSKKAAITYTVLWLLMSATFVIGDRFFVKPAVPVVGAYIVILFLVILSLYLAFNENVIKLIVCLVITIIAFIGTCGCWLITPSQSNELDPSKEQIKILYDELNIRLKAGTSSMRIGYVNEGDIYTVLDTVFADEHVWYKIETKQKLVGYVASGERHEYIECLFENENATSNERDESKDQILILEEFVNLRKEASTDSKKIGKVYEGEVYTVLERVDGEDYVWYKIENMTNEVGYLCAGANHAYIEFLEAQ